MSQQVDFYVISNRVNGAALKMASRLSNKFQISNLKALIQIGSKEYAHQLDQLMWSCNDTSFVAHEIIEQASQVNSPAKIHISYNEAISAQLIDDSDSNYDVLLNLCSYIPHINTSFKRIAEIVPPDDQGKIAARERYKMYQQNDCELDSIKVEL